MSAETPARPPRWFWIATALAVAWSILGCLACLTQLTMSAEDMAKLPQAQQDIWRVTPVWVKAAYAIAVGGSLAGSFALLARRSVARPILALSLLAVFVQFGFTFLGTPILKTVGPSAVGFPIFIILVGASLIALARHAQRSGWLRA